MSGFQSSIKNYIEDITRKRNIDNFSDKYECLYQHIFQGSNITFMSPFLKLDLDTSRRYLSANTSHE